MSLEAVLDGVAKTRLPDMVVSRISILVMVLEQVREYLWEIFGEATVTIKAQMHWVIPILTSITSFCLFLTMVVQAQFSFESSPLAGMLALIAVELLVPVAMLSCTALCCLNILAGEAAAAAWVASVLSMCCITQYLSQSRPWMMGLRFNSRESY